MSGPPRQDCPVYIQGECPVCGRKMATGVIMGRRQDPTGSKLRPRGYSPEGDLLYGDLDRPPPRAAARSVPASSLTSDWEHVLGTESSPPPQPMRCVGGPRATVPRVLRRGGRWLVHWEPGPRLLATSRRLQGALLPPPRLPTRCRSTATRGAASKDSGRPLGWRLHREKRAWYWGARGGREARRLLFGSYEAWVPPRMSRRVPCGRLVAVVRGAKIPSGLPTTRRCERGEGGRRAAMCGQPRASQLHGRRADACGEGACCVRVVVGLPVAAPRA